MSAPPVIDIDSLLQPVPGPNPAGVPIPDATLRELDELRKEPDPDLPDPNAPPLPPADWNRIIRITSESLASKSKDLIVAVRLLEAATKKQGAPGLRDGLRLLHRLVSNCWDRLHPTPGEGEGMDVREGPFKWINDLGRGAKFPQTVTTMPLARLAAATVSYVDWLQPARKAELEPLLPKADPKAIRGVYDDLTAAKTSLHELAHTLDEKMGADVAPDFLSENSNNLGTAIDRCLAVVSEIAKRRGVPLTDEPPPETDNQPATTADANPAVSGPVGVANTREGLYRQIGQIAEALRHLEPHSPIPYVLERCVKLGSLPFPDLMRAIIRENATLDELDRLLGLEKKD